MDFSICLPNSSVLQLDSVCIQDKTVIFQASSLQLRAICPKCQHTSEEIHSRYRRTSTDLLLSGLAVQLICIVKKFFRRNNGCSQRIFVERLDEIASVFARRTERLDKIICSLASYAGGRTVAKVTEKLSIWVSRQTLIWRILKVLLPPPTVAPRIIGIDDFAFRRKRVYGTLLTDLERCKPFDLIPGREADFGFC